MAILRETQGGSFTYNKGWQIYVYCIVTVYVLHMVEDTRVSC